MSGRSKRRVSGAGAPEAAEAATRLKQCVAVCEDDAEQVFPALHETPDQER
ncbi:Chromate resistance protein ChrB [Streptomyces sp. NPDC001002]